VNVADVVHVAATADPAVNISKDIAEVAILIIAIIPKETPGNIFIVPNAVLQHIFRKTRIQRAVLGASAKLKTSVT
jgi:hypothetical protein